MYTFALYRIVDVYTRAALGEILAFIFVPLVLLGLYEMIYNDKEKWWILPIGIFLGSKFTYDNIYNDNSNDNFLFMYKFEKNYY